MKILTGDRLSLKNVVTVQKGTFTIMAQTITPKPDSIEEQKLELEASDLDQYDDPIEARRIRRKIDYRLLPLLVVLYTLSFLDRVNIGNARLWNLEKDLGMDGYDYNIAVLSMHPVLYPFLIRLSLC